MIRYGFKYNGEGPTIFYQIVEGIPYEDLIVGKYYIKDNDGCYLYLGTTEDKPSHIEPIFNYTGGPYEDPVCTQLLRAFNFKNCKTGKEIKVSEIVTEKIIDITIGKFYKDPQNTCYEYLGETYEASTGTMYIYDGPFEDCDCEYKPEPPTTENSECVVSTCKGKEQHINVSNDILNLLEQRDYHTFKWNNKCYYIVEVVGEENPELPIMDIEHLNGIYPGCTECNNDGVTHKDNTEYYENVNCEFADAIYNKAMSDRYGVEFCCEKDLQRLTIKKKLLDAGQLQDDIDLCEF